MLRKPSFPFNPTYILYKHRKRERRLPRSNSPCTTQAPGTKQGYRGSLLFDDVIWANPAAIAFGRLSELRLDSNGVGALGGLLFAYLKLNRLQEIR